MNILWIIVSFGGYLLYKSFFPVVIKCVNPLEIECDENTVIIDLRDYNISAKQPVRDAFLLPYAYLKRYHHQLNGKKLYIIVPNVIVRNLSVRFLKSKGCDVIGYCLIPENKLLLNELQFKKCINS